MARSSHNEMAIFFSGVHCYFVDFDDLRVFYSLELPTVLVYGEAGRNIDLRNVWLSTTEVSRFWVSGEVHELRVPTYTRSRNARNHCYFNVTDDRKLHLYLGARRTEIPMLREGELQTKVYSGFPRGKYFYFCFKGSSELLFLERALK